VTPALVRLWEGDASALVSVEMLMELDASGLVFMRREGTEVHYRVISSTTDAQLRAMGITFTARIYATTAEVIVSALPATVVDQSDIACSLAAVTVETYRLDWGTLVEAAVDSVAATGLQATIIGAQKAYATLGTVVVTGNDLPQIDTYVKWDADFWTVGDQFEVVMDRYLGRWYNESGTGHDFDIYTYSSDQTIRFRQVDAGGAYDWCSYDNIRFGNGKCRIRILGYMPSGTTSLRIRINDAIGGHWIGAQIEDTQWVLGDDTDYDRSGWDTGYSAGAFTCVMQFDGSSLKGRRVGSLSPSLTFDSWDIDHTWSHSIGSNHKPVIAIGSVTPPIDHGYITILEYWNDWS
jgi:hypothetical protein